MKIKEFQKTLADILNGNEKLVQGGCKAFAEDTRDVYDLAEQWVQTRGVAIVIVTPEMQRNGDADGFIPADTQLQIQCSERPAVARLKPGAMTALDAAEAVMHGLDGSAMRWMSSRQTFDSQRMTLTVTVVFATAIHFTGD